MNDQDGALNEATRGVTWFADLSEGRGLATGMDPELREVLRSATEDVAKEIAAEIRRDEDEARARQEAAERAQRQQREAAERRSAAVRAAARLEAERLHAAEQRQRRTDVFLRVLFGAYVIGGFTLFLLQWQRALASGDLYDTIVFLYPLPFGIVGGILAKKLLDRHDRHGLWQFVVGGVLLWLAATITSLSIVQQQLS